jgi:hypothetical protein
MGILQSDNERFIIDAMIAKSIPYITFSLAATLLVAFCQPAMAQPASSQPSSAVATTLPAKLDSPLEQLLLPLIPEPQEVVAGSGLCLLDKPAVLVLADSAPAEDRFASLYFSECLKRDFGQA